MGRRGASPSAADRQRHQDADQGILQCSSEQRPDLASRRYFGARPHERYAAASTGISMRPVCSRDDAIRWRSSAATDAHVVAAVGACPRSRVRTIVRSDFGCCSSPALGATRHWAILSPARSQSPAASGTELPTRCNGRDWRSRLLGPARAVGRPLPDARGRKARRKIRPLRSRAWKRQRNRAQAHRQCADRLDLQNRFPFDPGVLPAGRSRLFRQRRCNRRDRHLPTVALHAAACPLDAASLLPGISPGCRASIGLAVVVGGRSSGGRFRMLRHHSLRAARRGSSVRHPPNPDACRARARSMSMSKRRSGCRRAPLPRT